jgi:serine/threonine protein kinase
MPELEMEMSEHAHLENGFSSKESKPSVDHMKRAWQQADQQNTNNLGDLQESGHTEVHPEASASRPQENDLSRRGLLEVQKDDSLYYQFPRDGISKEELNQLLKQLSDKCCSSNWLPRIEEDQYLGGYFLTSELGQGNCAKAFHALNLSSDKYVAIKVLKPDKDGQIKPEDVGEFCRELKRMAFLDHPYVMPLWGFGCKGRVPFLVTEYMSGGTLKGIRFSRREQVVQTMEQLCSGAQYLQDNGIIHQDLKPANILLKANGEAKISDFGVAVIVGTKDAERCWGTPRYKAPEQWEGKACLQSDVYALGLIAFELLTGKVLIGCMIDSREYKELMKDEKAKWVEENKNRYKDDKDLYKQWEIHEQYRCLHERTSEWLEKRAPTLLKRKFCDAFLPALVKALKPDPQERIQSPNDLVEGLRNGLLEAREREKQTNFLERLLFCVKKGSQEITWGN